MALTVAAVKQAKPEKKVRKIFDGGGLYLEVTPKGGKYWRYKYRFQGREKRISMGVFPRVSLKEARQKRDEARRQLDNGIDPGELRKQKKASGEENTKNSFEVVGREWFAKHAPNWAQSHASKIIRRLERDVFPWLGKTPIHEIAAPEILKTIRRVEDRGAVETAHRVLQNISQIFRYAIATGRASRDTAADLRGALPPTKPNHHPTIIDPKAIGGLMRAIHGYKGYPVTRFALLLAPLVFVRPGELRHAEWIEIDLENAEWRIPAEKMKAREQHIVPLSRQAVRVLEELKPLTGRGRYVFPSIRTNQRPMSENTVNAALRRIGYSQGEMTGHGFRSMASTLLNEQGWNRDAIERQLAHAERNTVRAAYNYAEHLEERKEMMQAWADFLDGLRLGASILPFQ